MYRIKTMFTNKTSLIKYKTKKDFKEYLINTFKTLKNLNLNFNELIIVDSSDNYHSDKINFECKKEILNILKQNHQHLSKEILDQSYNQMSFNVYG